MLKINPPRPAMSMVFIGLSFAFLKSTMDTAYRMTALISGIFRSNVILWLFQNDIAISESPADAIIATTAGLKNDSMLLIMLKPL